MIFEKYSGNDEACQPVVPAVLLLRLCGIPQVVEAVGRKLGKIHVSIGHHLLHRGPATAELCRAGTKGALGVNPLLARNVDQGKEQVAKLHLALVYRGTTDGARQFIEAQDKLIEELYAEPEEDPIEEGEAADPAAATPESEVTG